MLFKGKRCLFNLLICESTHAFVGGSGGCVSLVCQDFMLELVWTHNISALYGIRNRLLLRALPYTAADIIPIQFSGNAKQG